MNDLMNVVSFMTKKHYSQSTPWYVSAGDVYDYMGQRLDVTEVSFLLIHDLTSSK